MHLKAVSPGGAVDTPLVVVSVFVALVRVAVVTVSVSVDFLIGGNRCISQKKKKGDKRMGKTDHS